MALVWMFRLMNIETNIKIVIKIIIQIKGQSAIQLVDTISKMFLHARLHKVSPERCIVTLIAFIWLFTNVFFQMLVQIACIITKVAFG